jgi:hypothetical protein
VADSWRDQRAEAAEQHAQELRRRQAAESAQARVLIAEFVAQATARGVPPVRLRAWSYDGRARYPTSTTGWYLRRNQSVAVGTDGEFYLLSVPRSLRSRLTGARLAPSDPPLILGKGARDGESIDLVDALSIALGDAPRRGQA